MFAVPPIFAVPAAVVPLAAWSALVSATSVAAFLFAASALTMVVDGLGGSLHDLGLKAGAPPVMVRHVPDARPVTPSVSVLAVKTSVASLAVPATPRPAALVDAGSTDTPTVDEVAAGNGFISASRLRVVSDVTVRSDPRSGSRPLGTLHRGERVEVAGKQAGWVLVRQGRSLGWVWGEFLGPV